MTATTQEMSLEDRVAALPERKDPRSRVTTRKLMAKHQMKGGTNLDWAEGDEIDTAPACAGTVHGGTLPDNAFFPADRHDDTWMITRDELCARCPVMSACYEFGLTNEYVGLWGGVLITQDDADGQRLRTQQALRVQRQRDLQQLMATIGR